MSQRFTDKGREFLAGSGDWGTNNHSVQCLTLDGTLTDTAIKAITGATNASPIVITSASHGASNGDIIVVRGIVGNTSANGTWKAASVATNTITLTTVNDGLNSTGNGAYSSGGCLIDLTLGDNLDDYDAAIIGTAVALTTKTQTLGVLDADDPTFAAMTGTVHGILTYYATGTASTSRSVYFSDGKTQVEVQADAASSATTLWVKPLEGPIASGTAMIFSNGVTATTSGAAATDARSISVTAIAGAIAAGHTADVQTTGSLLPVTLSSGGFTLTYAATGIAKL